jgi:hypothetical protein
MRQSLSIGVSLVALVLAADPTAAAVTLKPIAVEDFFIEPERPAVLKLAIESGDLSEPIQYQILDYAGARVAAGKAGAASGKIVEIAINLPQGYYDLEFPAANQRFGLFASPAWQGEPDPFLAIDSAMSWLVRDGARRESLIKNLRRSGIAMSRERLSWGEVSPAADRWDWEGGHRFETIRRFYARQSVPVLEMFHDSPGWTGKVGPYPDDLAATARGWREIARRWRPTWGALEIWNEPNIHFGGNLPADQYVALVKTISYAVSSLDNPPPLVGGVIAEDNRAFLEAAARNGLLDCVDAVSFHTYAPAPALGPLIGRYRAWLKAFERPSMPLWITECGRPWKKGPGRPPRDQDSISALDIAMKAVEARAGGIACYFAFVYPFYEENENNFGMTDRQGTPLRSMAAYARLASVLARKQYLGDLKCDDGTVQGVRVFADDRETVAVFYTGKPEADAKIPLPVPVLRSEGIDGRRLTAAENATLPVPDGLTYAWLDRSRLGDRLLTDTSAMRLWTVGQEKPPQRPAPSPIVLRFGLDRQTFEAKPDGYHLAADRARKVPLVVHVFNLSSQAQRLVITPLFSSDKARLTSGGPQPIEVPAEGRATVRWEADLDEALATVGEVQMTVSAAAEAKTPTPPLVVRLFGK